MTFRHFIALSFAAFGLLVAACSPAAEPTTRPPTVTPIPTYNYVLPTAPPQVATAAATVQSGQTNTSSLDPVKVERGMDRYVALECGTCHGAAGEGTDDSPALANTELSEEAFITFLRTGGTLGNDHLYSTDRLSDSGGRNLYQFILSLGQSGAEQTPDA